LTGTGGKKFSATHRHTHFADLEEACRHGTIKPGEMDEPYQINACPSFMFAKQDLIEGR
jgi:hypothetical protein